MKSQASYGKFCCLLIVVIFLISCGSSNKSRQSDSNTTQTGTFTFGKTSGIGYKTPSMSGVTNENGEFLYLPGETVTFSVGTIELGSVVGADEITPFDLYGLTPPSTEEQIRSELDNTEVTDFDRVTNITLLLWLLDTDNYPNNGIDLANLNDVLADETMSINSKSVEFYFETLSELSEAQGIINYRSKVNLIRPVVYLYQAINVEVSDSVVETIRTEDQDGDPYSFEKYAYTEKGGLSSYELEKFKGLDNYLNRRIEFYTYSESGKILTEIIELFYAEHLNDWRSIKSYTYDEDDLLSKLSVAFEPINSEMEERVEPSMIYSYIYDNNTYPSSFEGETNFSGVQVSFEGELTYNERGQIASVEVEAVAWDSGLQSETSYTVTYDTRGYPLTQIVDRFYAQEIRNLSYDNDGLLLFEEIRQENGGDPEEIYTRSYRHDENGVLLARESTRDFNADGIVDERYSYHYIYDSQGNLLTEEYEADYEYKEQIESETATYTYITINDGLSNILTEYWNSVIPFDPVLSIFLDESQALGLDSVFDL